MTQLKTKAKLNSTTQLSKGHFTFMLGYVVEDATVTVNRRTAMKSPFLYFTFAKVQCSSLSMFFVLKQQVHT